MWFEEVKGQPEMFLEQESRNASSPRERVTTFTKEATVEDYKLKLLSLCKKGKVQGLFFKATLCNFFGSKLTI